MESYRSIGKGGASDISLSC